MTRDSAWTSWRGEASETLRRPSAAARRYVSTSRKQTHKRGFTRGLAALIEMDQLSRRLRRESVTTTLLRDRCPSTSAAINLLPFFVVESFGRLGTQGSEVLDQLAAIAVGGTDGARYPSKDVCKKHLFQIISVTTQVAIS